jgi:hypothetical protein
MKIVLTVATNIASVLLMLAASQAGADHDTITGLWHPASPHDC